MIVIGPTTQQHFGGASVRTDRGDIGNPSMDIFHKKSYVLF